MTVAPVPLHQGTRPPSVLRHASGFLAISSVFAGGLNTLYALLLTHRLSTTQYAIFAGAQSVLIITGIIGSAGVPWVLARETAMSTEGSERRRQAVTFAFWANVAFGLLTAVAVALVVSVFGTPLDAGLVAATIFVLAVGSTGLGLLQGRGDTALISAIFGAEAIVKIFAGVVLVFAFGAGTAGALTGSLAGSALLLASLPAVRRDLSWLTRMRTDAALWLAAARIGILQTGIGVMSALDVLLVAAIPATRDLGGTYQVASALGKIPLFVALAVATAVFPTLMAADSASRRAEALRTYMIVAGFVWLVLLTVPQRMVRLAFPAEYSSLTHWLPYTAALGFALGALTLLTTFVQSEPTARHGLPRVAFAVLALAGGGVTGALLGAVHGFAIGSAAGAWAGLLVVAGLASERRGIVLLMRRLRSRRLLMAGPLVAGALIVAEQQVFVWLAVVALAIPLTLVSAFPEFAHGLERLRRRRPPSQRSHEPCP
jgi:O-antigen/teichoic acid export membrane protein